jgi:hypothetical protein
MQCTQHSIGKSLLTFGYLVNCKRYMTIILKYIWREWVMKTGAVCISRCQVSCTKESNAERRTSVSNTE